MPKCYVNITSGKKNPEKCKEEKAGSMPCRNGYCFKEIKLKINFKLIHHFNCEDLLREYWKRKGNEVRAMVDGKNGHKSLHLLPSRG